MNGEIPSVPITTLAGVASLTDLLPELPLPTPLVPVGNKSLLFHPKIAEDAKRILNTKDDNLVSQLVHALQQTSTDHIELKDSLAGDSIEGEIPELLRAILAQDPQAFKGGPKYNTANSSGGSNGSHDRPESAAAAQPSGVPHGLSVPSNTFQQQFLQFTGTGTDGPTVNGGSPSIQTADTPPHGARDRGRHQQKPSTVSSPAQASAAPLTADSPGHLPTTARQYAQSDAAPDASDPQPIVIEPIEDGVAQEGAPAASDGKGTPGKKMGSREPVIVIEPLDIKSFTEETRRKKSSKGEPVVQLEDLNVLLDEGRRDSKKNSFGHYNVVSSSGSEHKLTLKLSKSRGQEERKGTKRRRSEDDEAVPEDEADSAAIDLAAGGDGEYAPSLSERVKRRRRQVTYKEGDSDEGEDDDEFRPTKGRGRGKRSKDPDFQMGVDDADETPDLTSPRGDRTSRADMAAALAEAMKKKKERRQRLALEASMFTDDLVESNTYKKFNALIESVMESAENADPAELNIEDEDDIVGLGGQETLISKPVLVDLCNEAAKLKALGGMNKVPFEKLVKLLTLLQYSIKDGCKVIPLIDEESHDANQLLRDLNVDRVLCAVDASLTALYVMTATDMPKEVYIEDVIDRVVRMTRLQVQNTIFPEFDPVYRIDPKNKSGYQSNMKMKRARASGVRSKSSLLLYNKLTDVVENLAELINIQELTDTIILQTSTLAVSAFFVENISELQLDSLKLITNIFSRYEKHRQLIIEDILASLARLPSSKKNLRNYRLNADEQIQMVTALALELIQCVVRLPHQEEESEEPSDMDNEVVIVTSYETAMRTAHSFLAVFLFKCAQKGENNYKPLFENFVFDLLSTVNKPEWPAAELLLSLLGRLLVKQFSNKSVDMSLRVASLDYLGTVAARLRKDAISSRLNEDVINEIINHIKEDEEEKEAAAAETRSHKKKDKPQKSQQSEEDHMMECLQQALLEYLAHNIESDPALVFARRFYSGQWYRDATLEVERAVKQQAEKQLQKTKKTDEDDSDEEEEDSEKQADKSTDELEKLQDIQQSAEQRKTFLLGQIKTKIPNATFATFKPSPSRLDYDSACLVTRYLASTRPFSHSFDIYLTQILKVLCETAVAVRTKAMKCLTAVVEADPGILARADMQRGVHGRLLDHSTSVREAAVELIGKFILIRPELTEQYYDMLSERILDTGISVRKRVIKIFRDICLEQTDFHRIPDMCVKMIRRVNDEEGIKKLVNDTFQNMWFTPLKEGQGLAAKLLRRVMNITDVVAACRETGVDWFEQLLENLLKKEEDAAVKPVEKACTQLISCLVENVLVLEEKETTKERRGTCNPRQVACFATLYLFCKVNPELLVAHVPTVQPYLEIRCSSPSDYMVLHNVARILELSVPLMEHPSEGFLAQLEEDMMKLVLTQGMTVLQSCVSCLGSIVNNVTHNFKLVRDCFQKFFGVLSKFMLEHQRDPTSPQLVSNKPTLLRSLFTVGLLCRHFDFDAVEFGEKKVSIRERVFDVLMHFVKHEDEEVRHKAMTGLGLHAVRHYELMLGRDLRDLYQMYLTSPDVSERLCCQVLKNLQTYLTEEEVRMIKADHEWRKTRDKEDLKEMGDVQSGMASAVIQVYIKQILESFFHSQHMVRLTALNCVTLIMRQGLVHPVQCIPYLISMGTDYDPQIRVKADGQIKEVDKKYPGFIQMKGMQGIKMSYRLQAILQADPTIPVRGYRSETSNNMTSIISLNNFIYSLIRVNRNQRRAVLASILNMFDDTSRVPLGEVLYMADNLAHFPYALQDEPLYIMHQVDILVSVSGSNVIQSYKELLYPENCATVTEEGVEKPPEKPTKLDDDEDDDIDDLIARVPEDVAQLQDLYLTSQACVLLLLLKTHLKDAYGFTDNKIQRYSPTDNAKIWDRPMSRKHTVEFNPKPVIEVLKKLPLPTVIDDEQKKALLENYLEFKQLMLSIDPDDDEDDEDDMPPKSGQQTPAAGGQTPAGAGTSGEVDTPPKEGPPVIVSGVEGATTSSSQEPGMVACTVDLTKDVDPKAQEKMQELSVTMPTTPKLSIKISSSDRKRSAPQSSHHSSHSSHSHSRHKSHHKHGKHKKKKKKRRHSDAEDDSDEDNDSDFVP